MGNRGKGETPEELASRRLSFLPTESEGSQRNGTDLFKYQTKILKVRVLERFISVCPSLFLNDINNKYHFLYTNVL